MSKNEKYAGGTISTHEQEKYGNAIFCRPEVVKIFKLLFIEFHSIGATSSKENWFFDKFVKKL